jgi:hypothetical protein
VAERDSPFKEMKDFLNWIAQNFGVKHPIISTMVVMVLAGVGWNVFVRYVVGTKSEPIQPATITQTSGNAACSNIVNTGGSVSTSCSSENGKNNDAKKDSSLPSKDH